MINSSAGITQPAPSGRIEVGGGWTKIRHNPVLGGKLGTCFDVTVLKERHTFRMWFSWRPKNSIALVESRDGAHWSHPVIVLGPNRRTRWEDNINRPIVLKQNSLYHMWYTGQAQGYSSIGHAVSLDGKVWRRTSEKPVLSPEERWEKVAVMCPHVVWDESTGLFRMWYSGGEECEPDAIGYAVSGNGRSWVKLKSNPIFTPDVNNPWEQHKVAACHVLYHDRSYYMFYAGFRDVDHAQIGLARSSDGVTGWQRHPLNPLIMPTPGSWDHDACYKPSVVFDYHREQWMLWYNGRRGRCEQIGLVIRDGRCLGFCADATTQDEQ